MIKQILLALLLLSPSVSMAALTEDLAIIRPRLPAGTDVAQIQVAILRGEDARQAEQHGAANYLLRDLNGDGLIDLLVISEEQPRLENWETSQPCSAEGEERCRVVYGKRAMHFFIGQRDGSLRLAFTNDKFVLGGDEGGVFGDPLVGFEMRKNGTIGYSVYGGSAWRWSYAEVIQFRKNSLYVIGYDNYAGWTGDLRSDTKSVNLLTGEVKETHQKDANSPERTKRYRIALKPLVKLQDYPGQSAE